MALRDFSNFKPSRNDVNIILLNGGLGDHIGSLVAIDYMLKNYPWINFLIWVPDFLLAIAKNVLPPKAIVRNFTAMKTKYDREKTTVTTEWDGKTSPMKIHTVDYAFLKLCDENPAIERKNYLKINTQDVDITCFSLPERYAVLLTGYTAPAREFNSEAINGVADYIRAQGYIPVYLGQTETATGAKYVIQGLFNDDVDTTKGINLINQTTLLQAAKVMGNAKVVVGVDCGLMHLAGCTDTPIVGGFTTVDPMLRMPIRHNILGWEFYPVVPEKSLKCRFCQSNTNFLYGHDYRFCIYKDYECVKSMAADKFIEQIKKVL